MLASVGHENLERNRVLALSKWNHGARGLWEVGWVEFPLSWG